MAEVNKRFKDQDAENLANDREVLTYKHIQILVRKKLELLLSSQSLQELAAIPGNRLEKLKGHKKLYSIRINQQYRILFVWENNEAREIKINKHDKSYGK